MKKNILKIIFNSFFIIVFAFQSLFVGVLNVQAAVDTTVTGDSVSVNGATPVDYSGYVEVYKISSLSSTSVNFDGNWIVYYSPIKDDYKVRKQFTNGTDSWVHEGVTKDSIVIECTQVDSEAKHPGCMGSVTTGTVKAILDNGTKITGDNATQPYVVSVNNFGSGINYEMLYSPYTQTWQSQKVSSGNNNWTLMDHSGFDYTRVIQECRNFQTDYNGGSFTVDEGVAYTCAKNSALGAINDPHLTSALVPVDFTGYMKIYSVSDLNNKYTWAVYFTPYQTNIKILVTKVKFNTQIVEWAHTNLPVGNLGSECTQVDRESGFNGCIGGSTLSLLKATVDHTPLPIDTTNNPQTVYTAQGHNATYKILYDSVTGTWFSQKVQGSNITWQHPNSGGGNGFSLDQMAEECRYIQRDNNPGTLTSIVSNNVSLSNLGTAIAIVATVMFPPLAPISGSVVGTLTAYALNPANLLAINSVSLPGGGVDEAVASTCAIASTLGAYNPTYPPEITAWGIMHNLIGVHWNKVNGAVRYEIWRDNHAIYLPGTYANGVYNNGSIGNTKIYSGTENSLQDNTLTGSDVTYHYTLVPFDKDNNVIALNNDLSKLAFTSVVNPEPAVFDSTKFFTNHSPTVIRWNAIQNPQVVDIYWTIPSDYSDATIEYNYCDDQGVPQKVNSKINNLSYPYLHFTTTCSVSATITAFGKTVINGQTITNIVPQFEILNIPQESQISVSNSCSLASWTITPGNYSGSTGQDGGPYVTTGADNIYGLPEVYTISVSDVSGYNVAVSNSDNTGSSLTMFGGTSKKFTISCTPIPVTVCQAPFTQNVTASCDPRAGYNLVSGSVTRSIDKSAYPSCSFPSAPYTTTNSTYVTDTCVYTPIVQDCPAPLTQNVTVSCPTQNGVSASSGSITRSISKSASPACSFPSAPYNDSNSTLVSNTCVYPVVQGGATIKVISNQATSWTINPGNIKGSGTSAEYIVDPGNGSAYTILADSINGYSGPVISNDITGANADTFTLFDKEIGVFNLVYTQAAGSDYTLSNSGDVNVVKTSGVAHGQTTINKTLISGGSQPISLSIPDGEMPTGVSYSISGRDCGPTCSSTISFDVSATAQNGSYKIDVTGVPGNKLTSFNLNISSHNGCTGSGCSCVGPSCSSDLFVSCAVLPPAGRVGQNVTWTATVSGGVPPYMYKWSGPGMPTDPAPSTNPYTLSYSTVGIKTGEVTVTDSASTAAQTKCTAATATISLNPTIEEK